MKNLRPTDKTKKGRASQRSSPLSNLEANIMSLDWSVTHCENWEELVDEEEWPVTERIIWSTLTCGIFKITHENAPEFTARSYVIEKLYGGTKFLTLEDVQKRAGLYTNVSPLTRTQWLKQFIGGYMDDRIRDIKPIKSES
jgi:hypothetical protein